MKIILNVHFLNAGAKYIVVEISQKPSDDELKNLCKVIKENDPEVNFVSYVGVLDQTYNPTVQ